MTCTILDPGFRTLAGPGSGVLLQFTAEQEAPALSRWLYMGQLVRMTWHILLMNLRRRAAPTNCALTQYSGPWAIRVASMFGDANRGTL